MTAAKWLIALILAAGLGWLVFFESDEARIRGAHEELRRLLTKSGDESNAALLLDARALQALFAPVCEVVGDADGLVGSYNPQEMVSTVVRVQGAFETIDLTFGELMLEFPADDIARVGFRAELTGQTTVPGEGAVAEARDVVSELTRVDGEWLFSAFRFREVDG